MRINNDGTMKDDNGAPINPWLLLVDSEICFVLEKDRHLITSSGANKVMNVSKANPINMRDAHSACRPNQEFTLTAANMLAWSFDRVPYLNGKVYHGANFYDDLTIPTGVNLKLGDNPVLQWYTDHNLIGVDSVVVRCPSDKDLSVGGVLVSSYKHKDKIRIGWSDIIDIYDDRVLELTPETN